MYSLYFPSIVFNLFHKVHFSIFLHLFNSFFAFNLRYIFFCQNLLTMNSVFVNYSVFVHFNSISCFYVFIFLLLLTFLVEYLCISSSYLFSVFNTCSGVIILLFFLAYFSILICYF